jgi:cytochrome c oxidase assembly protein subunit 15
MSEKDLPNNWTDYLHGSLAENAVFNPVHTWTEYLNRLVGALLGVLVLALSAFCLARPEVNKRTTLFAICALASVVFNGWLGSQVVASELRPVMVSLHMVGAFFVQIFLILGFNSLKSTRIKSKEKNSTSSLINFLVCSGGFFLIIQIIMGIQIRESIDWIFKLESFVERENLINSVPWIFYIHRSFSWVIFAIAILTCYLITKGRIQKITFQNVIKVCREDKSVFWSLTYILMVISQMFIGGALNHLGFPMFVQPLHLLMANLMFGCLCFLLFNGLKFRSSDEKISAGVMLT